MRVCGIDPGMTGALAILGSAGVAVTDMPVFNGRVDGMQIHKILEKMEPDIVYIEDTQPMPKNGSIASFKLGLNTGVVLGVLHTENLPTIRVRPSQWKRKMGLIGKPKDAVRGVVCEIYPQMREKVRLVKHQGRADAIMIARYGLYDQIHHQTGEDDDRSDATT